MESFLNLVLALPLLVLWVVALVDLVRRRDLSGRARLVWAAAVVLLPYVGVFLYLFFRPRAALGEGAVRIDADELVGRVELLIDRRNTDGVDAETAREELRAMFHGETVS